LPHATKGFSLVPSKKELIWRILNAKMLVYIKSNQIKTDLIGLTFVALTKAGQGSEELFNILRNDLTLRIDELNGGQLVELLKSFQGRNWTNWISLS